jgi:pyruvate dehydrogenase phosphatase
MTTLAVPGISTVNRRPLSTHGLPKPPRATSPGRPHRFSAHRSPPQQTTSCCTVPGSPGPMSPPMSARSFGTFIDSEPSTPAYSPRMDYDWDSSTMVLLRPMSSSSEPSSPTEPVWDMIEPMKSPQQTSGPLPIRHKSPSIVTNETFLGTRLVPAPTKRTKSIQKPQPLEHIRAPDAVSTGRRELHNEVHEVKSPTEQATGNSGAPLGKLASKMKSMLRRRSAQDKKKEKKEKDYYDPAEIVHWTEM